MISSSHMCVYSLISGWIVYQKSSHNITRYEFKMNLQIIQDNKDSELIFTVTNNVASEVREPEIE